MRFRALPIPGAYAVVAEPHADERGSFARTFSVEEFRALGLETHVEQSSVSVNAKKGTLRGLHFQAPPHEEAKLVRCERGAMFDVLVDLRRSSPAFGTWTSVELTAENGVAVYIPKGVAHGFQTLEDDTRVHYQISTAYAPASSRGIRYDDPTLAIPWPSKTVIMSERDRSWPFLRSLTEVLH